MIAETLLTLTLHFDRADKARLELSQFVDKLKFEDLDDCEKIDVFAEIKDAYNSLVSYIEVRSAR